MARFQWRERVAQFWNATVGRLVPRLAVDRVADVVIDASQAQEWARLAANGDMDVAAWHQAMREEIRRNVIEQYLAGRGGTGPMTAREYGSCGGMIADQYRFLDRFAEQLARGEVSEGQAANRARMYINSAREARERAKERAAEAAGFEEVRWVEDPRPDVDHCTGEPGCIELAAMGWQPARPWPFRRGRTKLYPGSGGTPCLTSCRCHAEYR